MSRWTKTILLMAAVLTVGVSPALAKGPQDVSHSIHNLSSTGWAFPYDSYGTNEDEVCIFCHTPHGGSLTGPLWNHSLPAASSFTHYNSATLTTAAGDGSRVVNDESLLCMACHDGSVGTNRVLNPSNDIGEPTGPNTEIIGIIMGQRAFARIGTGTASATWTAGSGDLSDDHPVSFSYFDAEDEETTSGANGLNPPATALAAGVRFFGPNAAGGLRVECSSCHDPHVSYDVSVPGQTVADSTYTPFLVTSNAASKLCLACHNKYDGSDPFKRPPRSGSAEVF